MNHGMCPRCADEPCACVWDEPASPEWFGIVFLPQHTPACIVTPRGSKPTVTKHRCWTCYDILMLYPGYADCDPPVYQLECRGCKTQHLANFPEGEIPAWLEARLKRDAEPRTPDEIAQDYWGEQPKEEMP